MIALHDLPGTRVSALSIRQPWAWLIVHGHKDLENRTWPTTFRGELLVHASKTMSRRYYEQTCEDLFRMGILPDGTPAFEALDLGGFVGTTRIVDCQLEHPSAWKQEGSYGFVLRDSQPMPFVPYVGRLGFFNVPKTALQREVQPA